MLLARRAVAIVLIVGSVAIALGGCGGSEETAGATAAAEMQDYRSYLEDEAASLLDWTEQLRGQIAVGEVGKAESRYATSRVQYGQLLPAQLMLAGVDRRLNGAESEGKPFTGYHRIERSLFGSETTAGLKPVAKALVLEVEKLRDEIEAMPLKPAPLAAATEQLLERVVSRQLTGEEEPYAGIDLVDASASIEGAEAAFAAIKPSLSPDADSLEAEVEAAFGQIYGRLKLFGTPARFPQSRPAAAGARFIAYGDAEEKQLEGLRVEVRKLQKLLAEVPASLAAE
jgi:iron uptake system component EfeO